MRRDPLMAARAKELRGNQTAGEDRMWSILGARRLGGLKFRRQHVLGRYIADFVCIPARLVVEVDGDTHGPDADVYDAKRTEAIERAGYKVIRFWNHYVMEDTDGGVAATILEALRISRLPARVKTRLEAEGYFEAPLPDPLPGGEREKPVPDPLPGREREKPVPDPLPGGEREKPVPDPLPGGEREKPVPDPLPGGEREGYSR